jgi:hypothetical protein
VREEEDTELTREETARFGRKMESRKWNTAERSYLPEQRSGRHDHEPVYKDMLTTKHDSTVQTRDITVFNNAQHTKLAIGLQAASCWTYD